MDGQFVLAERSTWLPCPGFVGRNRQFAGDGTGRSRAWRLLPALVPPVIGVGDKLHDAALQDAILLKRPRLRTWLAIRMPKFPLSDDEMQAARGRPFCRSRSDAGGRPKTPEADATVRMLAGSRLVTADGFGCTSCHKIGNAEPQSVAPTWHRSDAGGRRIRPWFDRWVRNPARIVPRMEMPAIQQPVQGVLRTPDLNEQLVAIWQAINTPGFNPPLPNPVRTVRTTNLAGTKDRPPC